MAMAKAKQSSPGDQPDASPGPTLGYEEARAALAEVVAALESGDVTLEEALALWEQGEEYARACEAWLAGAQARLRQDDQISQDEQISQQERSEQEPAPLSD
ncbi:MAG: exodeoxyribonuclease small subunit [Actinomycetota bacterium]|jgi:exodeoxyribonuclease VII small subunit